MASKRSDRNKPRDFVGSVQNAFNVLAVFDEHRPAMTLSEVAELTDMTRAGARRYLITLAELGYVYQEGRPFRLAPKVLQLGHAFLSDMPLYETVKPYLESITRKRVKARHWGYWMSVRRPHCQGRCGKNTGAEHSDRPQISGSLHVHWQDARLIHG